MRKCSWIAAFVMFGCGEDGAGGATAGGSSATSDGSVSETAQSETQSDSDTAPMTDGGSQTSSDSTSTTSASGEASDGGIKLDVLPPDGGDSGGNCQQQCGETDFSYIWIANSSEHTISKLNTRTLEEEGRYQTRPDGSGNPSRTSVGIDGEAVAVANRMGGITKIWARVENCEDKNANGMIETSSGAGDVLPFLQEECVAWHTEFPEATTQRPIAWTSGVYNESTCAYEEQKVWTASGNGMPGETWPCTGSDGIFAYRLDGETGVVEDTVHMPDITCGTTLGPYGAAVDFNNDLWMYVWATGTIVHVEYDTLDYESFSGGSYGITVDTEGRVWVDSGNRYDPMSGTWASKIGDLPGSGGSGVVQDLQGRVWTATQNGVGWIDMETMEVGDTVLLPEGGLYRGVAVDFDGYIWAVLLGGTTAHKIDPDTYEIETFDGLNSPYSYSDMSGGQLSNVVCNPPAG